jgi:hypothetical protein
MITTTTTTATTITANPSIITMTIKTTSSTVLQF